MLEIFTADKTVRSLINSRERKGLLINNVTWKTLETKYVIYTSITTLSENDQYPKYLPTRKHLKVTCIVTEAVSKTKVTG